MPSLARNIDPSFSYFIPASMDREAPDSSQQLRSGKDPTQKCTEGLVLMENDQKKERQCHPLEKRENPLSVSLFGDKQLVICPGRALTSRHHTFWPFHMSGLQAYQSSLPPSSEFICLGSKICLHMITFFSQQVKKQVKKEVHPLYDH